MSCERSPAEFNLTDIYQEAGLRHQESMAPSEILTASDWKDIEDRRDRQISDFNTRYGLDGWDYAIAGSCGLFAAMLDLLCVRAPPKPTVKWNQEVDGIFNQWIQEAFNKVLPPDLSDALSKRNPIGAPDSSVMTNLIGAPAKVINPINHRLRSLAHDPILGFLFGVWDMINGTCTVATNGAIRSFPSTKDESKVSSAARVVIRNKQRIKRRKNICEPKHPECQLYIVDRVGLEWFPCT